MHQSKASHINELKRSIVDKNVNASTRVLYFSQFKVMHSESNLHSINLLMKKWELLWIEALLNYLINKQENITSGPNACLVTEHAKSVKEITHICRQRRKYPFWDFSSSLHLFYRNICFQGGSWKL